MIVTFGCYQWVYGDLEASKTPPSMSLRLAHVNRPRKRCQPRQAPPASTAYGGQARNAYVRFRLAAVLDKQGRLRDYGTHNQ